MLSEKWILKERVIYLSYSLSCVASEDRPAIWTQVRRWKSGSEMTSTMETVARPLQSSSFSVLFLSIKKEILRKWMLEYQNTKDQINKILKWKQRKWLLIHCCSYVSIRNISGALVQARQPVTNHLTRTKMRYPDWSIRWKYGQPCGIWYHEINNPSLGNTAVPRSKESPESKNKIRRK